MAALDAVPWPRLHHAYGPADDVPVHLYAATVGQAETRAAAWWELWGNVHHQGTVYEATVHAVPFIAAIAEGDLGEVAVGEVDDTLEELPGGVGLPAVPQRKPLHPQVLLPVVSSRTSQTRLEIGASVVVPVGAAVPLVGHGHILAANSVELL